MLAFRVCTIVLLVGWATNSVCAFEVGDVNRDGEVNFLDISPFIEALSSGEFQFEADVDGNGFVDFLDIPKFIAIFAAQDSPSVEDELHQLVRINANMLVEDPQSVLEIAQRAKDSGGTGIILSDSKLTNFWSILADSNYVDRANFIIDGIRAMGLDVHLTVRGLGYSGAYLAINPNLATGYPIEAVPLTVQGDKLVPVETATVIDGGFEQTSGSNRPLNARFQDSPGQLTFVDTILRRSGNSALRTDAVAGNNSRLFTTVEVIPWQQYTLKVWVKTDSLSASNWTVLVRDLDAGTSLTNQRLSEARDGGGRTYFSRVSDYTTDWTEMSLSFNSGASTELDVALAVFGGTSGSVWWDDLSVEATPTMNWLQRDSLPVILTSNGMALIEGVDFEPISDPELGQSRFAGNFDNYHAQSDINLTAAGLEKLNQGDTVYLNGYHTLVTASGQTGMSWHDPEGFALRAQAVEEIWNTFAPDGIHIGDNEIRMGGAEPFDRAFGSTGQALAAHFEQVINDVNQITNCEAELFMWSDMFDPDHNAGVGFYQVEGDLSGSWNGIDPDSVTMMPWRATGSDQASYDATLQHFSNLGFEMVLGGYYDENVADNELLWRNAAQGVDAVVGSMYTTWTKDFSEIEAFAEQWQW